MQPNDSLRLDQVRASWRQADEWFAYVADAWGARTCRHDELGPISVAAREIPSFWAPTTGPGASARPVI